VRPDSSWCSLCYHDLRPTSQLVTASGGAVETAADTAFDPADDADGAGTPLADVSVEPEDSGWQGLAGDDEIVDAELVGDDGRIIAPRSGSHDALAADGSPLRAGRPVNKVDLDAAPDETGEPSGLAGLSWSCKCGEEVSFDESVCPVCGGPFLGDLREGNGGRHRPGNSPLAWLPESRQVRLAAAAFLAIALAVLIPVLLTLIG
jgi:hypothetical protein